MIGSKNRFSRKKMSLHLTSLLDMFTIILVFLMVSFQSEDKGFVLKAGVKLPVSSVRNSFKTGVNMAVTGRQIFVEGVPVYNLEGGGKVKESDFEKGRIDALEEAINDAWKLHKREEDAEDIVVLQADKDLPYRTLHLLMRSAAHAGVFRFRLVVEKE